MLIIYTSTSKIALLLRLHGISIENKGIATLIQKILKNKKKKKNNNWATLLDHDYYVADGQKYYLFFFSENTLASIWDDTVSIE